MLLLMKNIAPGTMFALEGLSFGTLRDGASLFYVGLLNAIDYRTWPAKHELRTFNLSVSF
jgi:hypothetical protein